MSIDLKNALVDFIMQTENNVVRNAEVVEAVVTSTEPYEFTIDGSMGALPKSLVRIPDIYKPLEFELKGLNVEVQEQKYDVDGSKVIYDNSLKVGDKVFMIKNLAGQLFYVLGRL